MVQVFIRKTDIYINTKNGKVLISDPNTLSKDLKDFSGLKMIDTIIVPDGVVGIQAGTYNIAFDYMFLPKTFKFVNYNEDIINYEYYVFMEGSYTGTNKILYDKTAKENPIGKMNPLAFSITNSLGGHIVLANRIKSGKIIFDNDSVPKELDKHSFLGDLTGFAFLTDSYQDMTEDGLKNSIKLKNNEKKAYISYTYSYFDEDEESDVTLTIELVEENQVLTDEYILRKIFEQSKVSNIDEKINKVKDKTKFLSKNKEVKLGEIKENMYITVVIDDKE